MILGENIGSVFSKGHEIQRVFSKGKLVWEKERIDYNTTAFTIQALDNASVMVQGSYKKPNVLNFKYSINGGDWNQLDTKSTININKDDTISIIGTDIYVIKITGLSDIYGNIMSLKFGDNFVGQTTLQDSMFIKFPNSDIRKADKLILPATTLGRECYSYMFDGCHSLITAPELPATILAIYCYADMFRGCTSLTTAPELPATTLSYRCYYEMFRGCTSLTTAPKLPATTLEDDAVYENMFMDCTSLTTAPELPAKDLRHPGCYIRMFMRCKNLINPPKLPATTLSYSCYMGMFAGCTSLTTAPKLPATTLVHDCYSNMFNGCSSLNHIKCYALKTQSNTSFGECLSNWTTGVSSEGTFVCWKNYGDSLKPYIPSTWTVEYLD